MKNETKNSENKIYNLSNEMLVLSRELRVAVNDKDTNRIQRNVDKINLTTKNLVETVREDRMDTIDRVFGIQ